MWFQQFKAGVFDLEDWEHPTDEKQIEDTVLEAILDEDPGRSCGNIGSQSTINSI